MISAIKVAMFSMAHHRFFIFSSNVYYTVVHGMAPRQFGLLCLVVIRGYDTIVAQRARPPQLFEATFFYKKIKVYIQVFKASPAHQLDFSFKVYFKKLSVPIPSKARSIFLSLWFYFFSKYIVIFITKVLIVFQ